MSGKTLTNEKHTGNALLQKSYVTDYLSKRKKRNHGEVPQYYVEQSHPAIVDINAFQGAQELLNYPANDINPATQSTHGIPSRAELSAVFAERNSNGKRRKGA
ncbi:MAG: hypothetical protein R2881_00365 [Eubacteriales bacterium]